MTSATLTRCYGRMDTYLSERMLLEDEALYSDMMRRRFALKTCIAILGHLSTDWLSVKANYSGLALRHARFDLTQATAYP